MKNMVMVKTTQAMHREFDDDDFDYFGKDEIYFVTKDCWFDLIEPFQRGILTTSAANRFSLNGLEHRAYFDAYGIGNETETCGLAVEKGNTHFRMITLI